MNPSYDETLEKIWATASKTGRPTRTEKREAVLSEYQCKSWKADRVYIAPSEEKRFACICSQLLDRYYIVEDDNGNSLRVGKECIAKVLMNKELISAKAIMERKELEAQENKRVRRNIAKLQLL